MLSRWCVCGGMPLAFILPFIFTQLLSMMFSSEAEAGLHFDCNNDYESVFCQFTPPNGKTNCSEYTMNITPCKRYQPTETKSCNFEYEDGPPAKCKCSLEYKWLIAPRCNHNATLLRGGQQLKSRDVDTYNSLKPKRPTITSVDPSGLGHVTVRWNTNYSGSIKEDLIALVTYGKKGGSMFNQTEKSTDSFEMRKLDPSSVYVVTVRTAYKNRSLNSLLSDSSNEEEFRTSPSPHTHLKSLIISLCIAVAIVSCTVLFCYAKCKAKYWDNIPKCHSNLLTMVPASEHMLLQLPHPMISSVSLDSTENDGDEDNQWSEGFTNDGNHQEESCGSTPEPSLGNHGKAISDNGNIVANVHAALRQALPHLTITSSAVDGAAVTSSNGEHAGSDLSLTSGALSFDNRSYNSCQIDMTSSSSAQMQPDLPGGPGCHRSEGDISMHGCPDPKTPVGLVTGQQGLNIHLGTSSPIETELSCQPRLADSGSLSQRENASFSLAWILNGTDVHVPCNVSPRAEAGYESFSEAVSGAGHNIPPEKATLANSEEDQVCDEGRLLSLPSVDMDYQH